MAEIEVIFSLIAHTVLCFRFSENYVDSTLMFQLLLSSICPKSKTFCFPVLCQWAGAWEPVTEHGQDNWFKVVERILHIIGYHVKILTGESWLGHAHRCLRSGWAPVSGWCIGHQLSLCFISLSLFFLYLFLLLLLLLLFYFHYDTFLISTHMSFLFFFWFSSPSH